MSQTPKRSSKGGTLQLKEISIIPITNNSHHHIQPKHQNHASSTACVKSSVSTATVQLNKKPQMSEDDVELLRKKRCNDRCDSSESSDSGVITMSVDSQATSDSSDPGSPFSHASSTHTEELTLASKILLPKAPQKRQSNLIDKNDKKRVRKDICTTTKSGVEIKLVPVAPSPVSNGPTSQEKKVTTITPSLNFLTTKPHLITFNSGPTPSLANINKMTDYYKLKKEVTANLSLASDKINPLSNAQQSFRSINATMKSATSPAVKIGSTGNINSNHLSVTQLGASTAIASPLSAPSRPINALNNNNSNKKSTQVTYEKKTAKIAPVMPVARKNVVPSNIKPTKKPVSIAPRLEPKCSSNSTAATHTMKKLEQQKETTTLMPSKQMQNLNNQTTSGPTVLLAAIRIPQQQTPTPSQPPPLGLIQKTTTTTTTTKLGPLIQLHAQHMIPNIIQIPNLVATSKSSAPTSMAAPKSAPMSQQHSHHIYGNNNCNGFSNETTQMLNAVLKLQAQAAAAAANSNGATQKPQQQNSFATQLSSHQVQQLFMTSPVLFNLQNLQNPFAQIATSSAIPALQPIQTPLISSYASSSMTQTTQSLHLPSLNAIIQSQNSAQQYQSLQLPQQQCFQTLLKSSAISMPPSLAFSSAFVQQNHQRLNPSTANMQQQLSQHSQPILATKIAPSKSVPPLAPASNFNPIQITKNIPKMISVKSSSSQTSPKTKSPPPLVINQKVSLPKSSPVAAAQITNLKQEICVVPPLPSPAKIVTFDTLKDEKKIFDDDEPQKDIKDIKSSISVLVEEKISTESAKSPILSQPKTIRFPPVNGKVTVWKKCVKISQKGVCNWAKCSKQFDSNSDLLDHLQIHIVLQDKGPFVCSWRDCKVNGREGSRGWLERHIISHVGSTKPFKCIVEKCGLRFGSQTQLQKHVNSHFNGSDQLINERKRTSDPLILKKVKKDVKKLNRARRQPWAARRFDFFDIGVVEMLKHRLQKVETLYKGNEMEVTFKGRVIGKRRSITGVDEFKVTWEPENIFDDEWIKRPSNPTDFKLVKTISLKSLTLPQRCTLTNYYEQHQQNQNTNNSNSRSNECINNNHKNSRKFKAKSSTTT